jgi:hypothetical protein
VEAELCIHLSLSLLERSQQHQQLVRYWVLDHWQHPHPYQYQRIQAANVRPPGREGSSKIAIRRAKSYAPQVFVHEVRVVMR